MVSYRLPVDLEHPRWMAPVDSFDLLIEEAGATARGAGLAAAAPVELMGSTLKRWTAAPPTGGFGEADFGSNAMGSRTALYWLVGGAGLLLLGGAALAARRGRRAAGAIAATSRVDHIEELARLDAMYVGRQAQVSIEEWAAYEAERARLKSAALAGGRPRP
jgi:hypothetical protein